MLILGIDMVEIERIKKSMIKKRFIEKVFSDLELKEFKNKNFKPQSIAASFCAKEAFSKAIGCGLIGLPFHEVQLLHNSSGKPYISLSGTLKKRFKSSKWEFSVSLTHTKYYASAVVVGYKKEKR